MRTVKDAINQVLTSELKMKMRAAASRRLAMIRKEATLSGADRAAVKNSITGLIEKEKRQAAREELQKLLRQKTRSLADQGMRTIGEALEIARGICQRL